MRVWIILGVLATICGAQVAIAADLPLAPAKFYDWTGVYAGVNVGTATGGFTQSATTTTSEKISGMVGGGQIGGNLQFGQIVVGAEIDGQWSNQTASSDIGIKWLATARLRVGAAYDRIQYYATGGAGAVQFTGPAGATADPALQAAWVVGVGSESAVTSNIILRFEVLYLQVFGDLDTAWSSSTAPTTVSSAYDIIGRIALSYKFGGWSFK